MWPSLCATPAGAPFYSEKVYTGTQNRWNAKRKYTQHPLKTLQVLWLGQANVSQGAMRPKALLVEIEKKKARKGTGVRVVSYHTCYSFLLERYGLVLRTCSSPFHWVSRVHKRSTGWRQRRRRRLFENSFIRHWNPVKQSPTHVHTSISRSIAQYIPSKTLRGTTRIEKPIGPRPSPHL